MKKLKLIIFFTSYLLPFIFINPAYAQSSNIKQYIQDLIQYEDIGTLISRVLSWGLIAAALLALLFLLWGGIQWILSGGDKAQLESARNRITGALIGLVVVAAVWAIFLIIIHVLGLPIETSGSPSNTGTGQGGKVFSGDCCALIGGNQVDPQKCCQTAALYNCVSNRVQSPDHPELCVNTKIDWACWAKTFPANGLTGTNDPCRNK